MIPTSPVFILRELIRCRSETPDDGGSFDLLARLLAPLGFAISRQRFTARGTPDVENFYAKCDTAGRAAAGRETAGKGFNGAPRHLLFAGHVDIVPAGAAKDWRFPPFAADEAEGCIFGRGAVDMKGGIACFIAAVARINAAKTPLNGAISLLLTADEEGPGINGTAKMLQWAAAKGEKWDAALVGEPSSDARAGDTIKIGRRGSLSAILRAEGQQGHVAYPQRAANPLPLLTALLQALLAAKLDDGSADFPPSNLELTSIDTGNETFNIIPARAQARFNIRFNPHWTAARLQAKLRALLKQAAAQSGAAGQGVTYSLEFAANPSSAFITHNAALVEGLAQAAESVSGKKPQLSTGGGTSDARFIKDYCPVAELGLVGKTMHRSNECAGIDDLERLTAIYQHFIQNFFAA